MKFVYDPSLVLYLPPGKLDASSFMSRDAYGRSCTVTGTVWTLAGRYFDGVDDQIDCGNIGGDLGTVELWVKPAAQVTTTSSPAPVARLSSSYGVAFGEVTGLLTDETLTILETAGGSSRRTAAANYTFEVGFYHLVFVWNPSQSRYDIYINGQLQTVIAPVGGHVPLITSDAFILARREPSSNTWGNLTIGEVRAYNRSLFPLEIMRNYLTTKWRYQ